MLSFTEHAQKLLVDYIREDFEQLRAVDCYRDHGTGTRGCPCLAPHAGYSGSTKNMGAEVESRDIKALVPPSTTCIT